jgi:multiple sugar transport system substrate-binding protein
VLPQVTLVTPVTDKAMAERLQGRVNDYTATYPNVTIDLRPITGMPRGPFNIDAWSDLLQGLASGGIIDVAIGWDVWAPGMIDRGILRPLDPYLADIGRPLERYFMQPSVQAFRRFGRVWMLPWQAQPVMLFYNRQLFDQASLPHPDKRAKWGDVEGAGGVLTKGSDKTKTWGFDVGGALDVLIYQNRGRIVDDPIEPIKPTLDEQPNVEALTWVEDLIKRLKIVPSSTDVRGDQRMAAFANGQMGMRLDRMSIRGGQYLGSPKVWDFPWGVVPPPGRHEWATSANFQSWGILGSSTKIDEAWSFIRHMCTKLPSEAKIDGVPAFLSLQGSPDLGRLLPEGTESYLRALAETVPVPAIPAANTLQQLLGEALFRVMSHQYTPADALREAQKSAMNAWGKQPKPTVVAQPSG